MGLWVCGLCWNWARWGLAFLAALHVNEATDSPRLVQLTGTTLWAPLLVGGVIGGVVADRFDRLRTIRVQMVVMVAMLLVAGTLLRTDRLEVWMMYPFLLLAGIGWVGDMTSRRSLVYETVGERRVDHAMAVEMASTASGVAIGNLLGGAAADALGVGNALLCLGGFLSVGLVALATVRRSHFVASSPAGRPPIGRELREGLALARDSRPLQSILGVTVLANGTESTEHAGIRLLNTWYNLIGTNGDAVHIHFDGGLGCAAIAEVLDGLTRDWIRIDVILSVEL